jgi:adenylate cyclase
LLVSFARAEAALDILMYPWRTVIGTAILVFECAVVDLRATLSAPSRWEWWQLGLGLCIPLLLMLHVTSTRVAESLLGVTSHYSSVLIVQWQLSPWLAVLQTTAVLSVWTHASIGVHFWLRTKAWYAHGRPLFVGLGLLLPTFALCGYVTAGNQVLRAAENPNYAEISFKESNLTDQKRVEIGRIARIGASVYLVLTMLPFAGRRARGWLSRRRRTPLLTHSSGQTVPLLAGATVLENVAGERHSPRFGLRRKSALHHLPDPGDKRAGQSARTIRIGGKSAGPYRSDTRHAAGLSDLPHRRHLCHATPGR